MGSKKLRIKIKKKGLGSLWKKVGRCSKYDHKSTDPQCQREKKKTKIIKKRKKKLNVKNKLKRHVTTVEMCDIELVQVENQRKKMKMKKQKKLWTK